MEGLNVINDLDSLVRPTVVCHGNNTDPCGTSRRVSEGQVVPDGAAFSYSPKSFTSFADSLPTEEENKLAILRDIVDGQHHGTLEEIIKEGVYNLLKFSLSIGIASDIKMPIPNGQPIYNRKFKQTMAKYFPYVNYQITRECVTLHCGIEELMDPDR